ncbi:hypothetical protein DPMN_124944 [Dreissena polymorpha]|uniref:NACHT domain-containing protein n=1 Tax=Dreissena polymorpha TaxID=45954 RepID=A0A9D4JSM4_DREPO|nr:hypothetical protein DPMN_124944 [Dreissena polymorpha]
MAKLGDVFTEKERTNWLKALLGLNITKVGLHNFVDIEIKMLQQSFVQPQLNSLCSSCVTANLLKCPTRGVCKPLNGICTMHDTPAKQTRGCPTKFCEKFRDEIVINHKFSNPSWKNTSAEEWTKNHWQIAKCFLPREGYANVNSIQNTDFNGVINVIINCKRFDGRFSFTVSSTNASQTCPLTEAREIGRAVRHNTKLTVTDDELKAYITTFIHILTDTKCLAQDVNAAEAVINLQKLQNDALILANDEFFSLLQDMQETITTAHTEQHQAISQHKDIALEEIKTFKEKLQNDINASIGTQKDSLKNELQAATDEGILKLTSETTGCIDQVKKATHDSTIAIELVVSNFNKGVALVSEEEINKLKTAACKNATEIVAVQDKLKSELETIASSGCDRISDAIDTGKMQIETATNASVEQVIYSRTQPENSNYISDCNELLRRLKKHYDALFSHLPICPLVQSRDKHILELFVPPMVKKIEVGCKAKRVKKYRNIFYTNDKPNRRIFIQGEPCVGKSTFATKIVYDWSKDPSETKPPKKRRIFQDLETLHEFKFFFIVTLRDSCDEREIVAMIKEQIIEVIYTEMEQDRIHVLIQKIIENELCCITVDGIDEWTDYKQKLVLRFLAGCPKQCTFVYTTRPWKMADPKIKDSAIDFLFKIYGVFSPSMLVENVLRSINFAWPKMKTNEFIDYVKQNSLKAFLPSPMFLAMLVCLWAEDKTVSGSKCLIYSTMIDTLFEKASGKISYFENFPIACFEITKYVQPNLEVIDALSKAAFYLLFKEGNEGSLVFNNRQLALYLSEEQKSFALTSGILTERKTASNTSRLTQCTFVHSDFQEFLAAIYIARNVNVIEDVIEEHMKTYCTYAVDVGNIFVFLCGLNIAAAHRLSCLLNDYYRMTWEAHELQEVIVSGYKEAGANNVSVNDIHLKLTSFDFDVRNKLNCEYLQNLLLANKSQVENFKSTFQSVQNTVLQEIMSCSSHCLKHLAICLSSNGLDLSSCCELITLSFIRNIPVIPTLSKTLTGFQKLKNLKFTSLTLRAEFHPPNSITTVEFDDVTVSATLLQRLVYTLSTFTHSVKLLLTWVHVKYHAGTLDQGFVSNIAHLDLQLTGNLSPGLLSAISGIHIKTLTLSSFEPTILLLQTLKMWTSLEHLSVRNMYSGGVLQNGISSAWLESFLIILSLRPNHILFEVNGINIQSCENVHPELLTSNVFNVFVKCKGDSAGLYDTLRSRNIITLIIENVQHPIHLNQTLQSLRYLIRLEIVQSFSNYNIDLLPPPSIRKIVLSQVKCPQEWLRRLLVKLSSFGHLVRCTIDYGLKRLFQEGDKNTKMRILGQDESVESSDMCNISLLCKNDYPPLSKVLLGANIHSLSMLSFIQNEWMVQTLSAVSSVKKLYLLFSKYHSDIQLPGSLSDVVIIYRSMSARELWQLVSRLSEKNHEMLCKIIIIHTEDTLEQYKNPNQSEQVRVIAFGYLCTNNSLESYIRDLNDEDEKIFCRNALRYIWVGVNASKVIELELEFR